MRLFAVLWLVLYQFPRVAATGRSLHFDREPRVSVKALTPKGFRSLFVLIAHPNEGWLCEQAKAFVKHTNKARLGADIVMHDRDRTLGQASGTPS